MKNCHLSVASELKLWPCTSKAIMPYCLRLLLACFKVSSYSTYNDRKTWVLIVLALGIVPFLFFLASFILIVLLTMFSGGMVRLVVQAALLIWIQEDVWYHIYCDPAQFFTCCQDMFPSTWSSTWQLKLPYFTYWSFSVIFHKLEKSSKKHPFQIKESQGDFLLYW